METTGSLIGSDFAAVCARYGAPLDCRCANGVLYLAYEGVDGRRIEDAVQLADGVIVAVADGIRRSATACCGQDLVGAPAERALAALGAPLRTEHLGESSRLEFADRIVTVHQGTIACIVPRRPTAGS